MVVIAEFQGQESLQAWLWTGEIEWRFIVQKIDFSFLLFIS